MNTPGGSGGVPPGIETPHEGVVDGPDAAAVPSTGDPTIDDALQSLNDLPSTPLAEHHDRLARVHEALHVALERSGDEPDAS
jgi:hypothetical protein